jgi:hypothetical protein
MNYVSWAAPAGQLLPKNKRLIAKIYRLASKVFKAMI